MTSPVDPLLMSVLEASPAVQLDRPEDLTLARESRRHAAPSDAQLPTVGRVKDTSIPVTDAPLLRCASTGQRALKAPESSHLSSTTTAAVSRWAVSILTTGWHGRYVHISKRWWCRWITDSHRKTPTQPLSMTHLPHSAGRQNTPRIGCGPSQNRRSWRFCRWQPRHRGRSAGRNPRRPTS